MIENIYLPTERCGVLQYVDICCSTRNYLMSNTSFVRYMAHMNSSPLLKHENIA